MGELTIDLYGTLLGHQNPIYAIENGLDAHTIYTAGNDKGVVEWDLEHLSFRHVLTSVSSSVYALHQIKGTDFLAIGLREGVVLIVDVLAKKLCAKLQVDKGAVFALASLYAKQELIAIGESGNAFVWSIPDFKLVYRFPVAPTTVRVIRVSPDERQIVFGAKSGQVYIFDVADYHIHKTLDQHAMPVTAVDFSKDGRFLLTGGRDAQLNVFDTADFGLSNNFVPHMFTIYGIAFHPQLPLFATGSRDKTFKLWHAEKFSLLKNVSRDKYYDSHTHSINAIKWTAAGDKLISIADDRMVKVWNLSFS